MRTLRTLTLFTAWTAAHVLWSQSVDLTFNPDDVGSGLGRGANSVVHAAVLRSDGVVVIGGAFNSYNGSAAGRIAALDEQGLPLDAFSSHIHANDNVYALAALPDAQLLVGGAFTSYEQAAHNRLVRLNADGSVDGTFDVGSGADGIVRTIAVQADGKVLVAGAFTTFNGQAVGHIVRLEADGAVDPSFQTLSGADDEVRCLALQPDGAILVGGTFAQYDGVACGHFARLNTDGTLDGAFQAAPGANNTVSTIALQSDGRIVIGGEFGTVHGTSHSRLARLQTDGSVDGSFTTNMGAVVNSCVVLPDDRLLLGGAFQEVNLSASRHFVARLTAGGAVDNTFVVDDGFDQMVQDVLALPDGRVLVTGQFASYNGRSAPRVARLLATGALDTDHNPMHSCSGAIFELVVDDEERILIGGNFDAYDGLIVNSLARLLPDGALDPSFQTGTGAGTNGIVECILVQPDGRILVGGTISNFDDVDCGGLVRLEADGSLDPTFALNTSGAQIWSIALAADDKVIVAGNFSTFLSQSLNDVARLNADGTVDATFDPGTGTDNFIYAVGVQSDGKVIIGGAFTTFNGQAANGLARLLTDGSLDPSFTTMIGGVGTIQSIVVLPDDRLFIGGSFGNIGGVQISGLALLNADGSVDTDFGAAPGPFVYDLHRLPDGKLLVGGSFNSLFGSTANCILRLNADGSVDSSINFGSGVDGTGTCRAVGAQQAGGILVGGNFSSFDGIPRNNIARVGGSMPTAITEALEGALAISPNPTTGVVRYFSEFSGPTAITIRDATGRLMEQRSFQATAGTALQLDLSQHSAGTYLVRLATQEGQRTARVVVVR